MNDPSIQHIPSCTDCGLDRSWDAAPVEGPPGSRVLPFYIDSQGCLTWYLYLTPDGYSAVVASGAFLCNPWWYMAQRNPDAQLDNFPPPTEPGEGERDEEPADFTFVAPSVEAFLYRWWLENALWHKLVRPNSDYFDATPITPDEQAYIDFYRQHPVSAT